MPAARSTGRRRSRCCAGSALSSGYALLGATWLMMKTEGPVAERARAQAKCCCSRCWRSWRRSACGRRWRCRASRRAGSRCRISIYPLAGAGGDRAHRIRLLALAARRAATLPPFLATIALFLLGYLGLVISIFPYLVPPSLTIWQTAAAPASQIFMLLGTLVLLPMILGYTAFVYWLFRGKVREGESYH